MNKFPVTKEVKKYLAQIAGDLPEIETGADTPVYRRVTGTQYLAMRKEAGLPAPNEEIKPNHLYALPEGKVTVNHFKKLKVVYAAQGKVGVDEYIRLTKDKAVQQANQAKDTKEDIAETIEE